MEHLKNTLARLTAEMLDARLGVETKPINFNGQGA